MTPLVGTCLIFFLFMTINVKHLEEAKVIPLPAKPKSTIQIDSDLEAVTALLSNFSVLLVYNLDQIHVKKTARGFSTGATGGYNQSFSLARLNQIAQELEGNIYPQKNSWTLSSSIFKPPAGEAAEPIPLQL